MEYMPEVIQVIPTEDYMVYVYFDDGSIKLYDAKEIIKQGVFIPLQDISLFIDTCTVLNGTLARAAELAGKDLSEFIKILTRYKIPWMEYTEETFVEDEEVLEELRDI